MYVFGTIEFDQPGLASTSVDPELRVIGAKGLIVDAGLCTKMCSVLDDAGNLYVSKQGPFEQVSGVRASRIAQGVISLLLLDKKTKDVSVFSGSGQATKVEGILSFFLSCFYPLPLFSGLGPCSDIYCGHRTFFAVGLQKVDVTNRDCLGKLRGPCSQCQKCPRFAGMMGLSVNQQVSKMLICLRCSCDASFHAAVEEVKVLSEKSRENLFAVSRKPRVEFVDENVALDVAMPLEVCEAMIAKTQNTIVSIRVPNASKMRVFAVSDIHTDFKGNMKWLEELVQWAKKEDFRNDVLIVAGDISHDMGIIETTLTLCCQAFGHVFHVCGNHELWVAPTTSTCKHGMHKLNEIQMLCQKLGVHCSPVVFTSNDATVKPLIISPLVGMCFFGICFLKKEKKVDLVRATVCW